MSVDDIISAALDQGLDDQPARAGVHYAAFGVRLLSGCALLIAHLNSDDALVVDAVRQRIGTNDAEVLASAYGISSICFDGGDADADVERCSSGAYSQLQSNGKGRLQ